MMLFNGDHKDTKIIGTVNGKNFYWKIDTGSAVTCMNINAFEAAFCKLKEKNLKDFKTDIFIKKEKVYSHSANSRRGQRKHSGYRLSTKIPATHRPQNQGGHFSIGTIQGIICHKKLHRTSSRHHAGTSQNVPDDKQTPPLHCRHRSSQATLDIWTLNIGQFRPQKSVYSANPELRST
jgi:hypothetical protein